MWAIVVCSLGICQMQSTHNALTISQSHALTCNASTNLKGTNTPHRISKARERNRSHKASLERKNEANYCECKLYSSETEDSVKKGSRGQGRGSASGVLARMSAPRDVRMCPCRRDWTSSRAKAPRSVATATTAPETSRRQATSTAASASAPQSSTASLLDSDSAAAADGTAQAAATATAAAAAATVAAEAELAAAEAAAIAAAAAPARAIAALAAAGAVAGW